ncbi:MAG TPA: PIN domain nuclease [Chthoniobacterales bacterium]|nr:PIN domain nuclease [Chthoniobacterales bacterium]
MVLADSSVWIDYFKGIANWQTDRLDSLLETEPVAVADLIFTEVLQGFDRDSDFREAHSFFAGLPFYELGGYDVCLQAAKNYRTLRRKGITVRKTIDVIIATGCIEWRFHLLHNDRDFDAMEGSIGLKVVHRN